MNKHKNVAISDSSGDAARFALFSFLALSIYIFFGSPANATAIAESLCTAVALVLGDIGRAVATFAVIFLGVGAMLGRVTFGTGILVVAGIGVVFGAGSFMAYWTTTASDIINKQAALTVAAPVTVLTAGLSLGNCGTYGSGIYTTLSGTASGYSTAIQNFFAR